MNGGVGRILKLLQQNVFGVRPQNLFGFGDSAIHAFGAFR